MIFTFGYACDYAGPPSSDRMPIPADIAAVVLFWSDRTCCVCRQRGRPVQVHHLDENPRNNAFANLAVLCVMCHGETHTFGGFARRLDAIQIRMFRDEWIAKAKAASTRTERESAEREAAECESVLDSLYASYF